MIVFFNNCSGGFNLNDPLKTQLNSNQQEDISSSEKDDVEDDNEDNPDTSNCSQDVQELRLVDRANTLTVSPNDSYCSIIKSANPNTTIYLEPGIYSGACKVRDARSLSITSLDPNNPAEFKYTGTSANVIDFVDADDVEIAQLFINTTKPGIDAIKFNGSQNIRIWGNRFDKVNGVAISAPTGGKNFYIGHNHITNNNYTAVYLGGHSGTTPMENYIFEWNHIQDVTTYSSSAVGYGMQAKLNSSGVVRYNTIYRTKGPGIMIYGSSVDTSTEVYGNYIEGAKNDAGINVAGRNVLVYSNILRFNNMGIFTQNYGGRNLLSNIHIANNTIIESLINDILVTPWDHGSSNILVNNIISKPIIFNNSDAIIDNNYRCVDLNKCFYKVNTATDFRIKDKNFLDLLGDNNSFYSADSINDIIGIAFSREGIGAVASDEFPVEFGNNSKHPVFCSLN